VLTSLASTPVWGKTRRIKLSLSGGGEGGGDGGEEGHLWGGISELDVSAVKRKGRLAGVCWKILLETGGGGMSGGGFFPS